VGPVAGRYRAPDEKTIRVVLDRLDPRALARALLGPRRRPGGRPSDSVRGYRARRVSRQTEALARDRLRAVAVDGKTSQRASWQVGRSLTAADAVAYALRQPP